MKKYILPPDNLLRFAPLLTGIQTTAFTPYIPVAETRDFAARFDKKERCCIFGVSVN